MRKHPFAFALAAVAALSASPAVSAAPRIALNVDGQANYSFNAPWANILGQVDWTNTTYWTGYVDGQYKVTWGGSGAPSISGSKSSFTVTGPGQGILNLKHDTPTGGGLFTVLPNGVSNLNIQAPDAVAGTPFRKPFLDKVNAVAHNSVIRYMDWMQTVNSPVSRWSQRNTSPYQTLGEGVNYENIVALSNYTNADAWINIPAKANDDYVRNLAKFLKTNLKPGLKVYVEYSNELWNLGDQMQGSYNMFQARADPTFNSRSDDFGKSALRAAERLRQATEIFKSEFGGSSRLVPMIGGFIANSYWGQWQIDWLKSKGVNLTADNYRMAIAPYVPGSEGDLGLTASDTKEQIIAKMYAFMNGSIKTWIKQNKAVTNAAGIGLDSYEAAAASFYAVSNPVNQALLPKFIELQSDPRIGQLYKDFINMWDAESGNGLFNAFGIAAPYSQWGQFALLNDINATGSPKYDAVLSFVGPVVPAPTVPVPEPATAGVLAVAAIAGLARRTRRA